MEMSLYSKFISKRYMKNRTIRKLISFNFLLTTFNLLKTTNKKYLFGKINKYISLIKCEKYY